MLKCGKIQDKKGKNEYRMEEMDDGEEQWK